MTDEKKQVNIQQKSMEYLEWPELCRRLSEFAYSPIGAERLREMTPEVHDTDVRRKMSMTSQMVALSLSGSGIPLRGFEDLRPVLEKLKHTDRLHGEELHQIHLFLDLVGRVRAFFAKREEQCPALMELALALDDLASLKDTLGRMIDTDGQIREDASPKLREYRIKARRSRDAIVKRLDAYVKDRDSADVLQDTYYTVREGRFVLPVKAGSRGSMDGIVHDISSSGATHFMEPNWLVEMNNAMRVAEMEIRKEIERILDDLSRQVSLHEATIRLDLDVMVELDMVHAKARLSLKLDAFEPAESSEGELFLMGLRHPLLVLRGIPVVANDLALEPEDRILVISGPNAGGKTVLLKAVGLSIFMARSGLFIPAKQGSKIPALHHVLADIGDQQDISLDMSTFSGHMRNLKEILEAASDTELVILDELAGSTDPQEGASLALAILEALMEQGARVVVSTHYPALKAWAQGRSGARNGAMMFDWDRMAPTYRMHMDSPGRSSALDIAARMGLPDRVLDKARAFLTGEETNLEELLKDLEQKRTELEARSDEAERLNRRLEEELNKRQSAARALNLEMESFRREKRNRLSSEVKEARQRLKETVKGLFFAKRHSDIEKARESIRRVEEGLKPVPIRPERPARPLEQAKPGDEVEVPLLGKKGVLLEDPEESKGRVRVQVGQLEIRVDPNSLGRTDSRGINAFRAPKTTSIKSPSAPEVPPEIDLRGNRVDDALDAVERYLDQALLGRRDRVRIIHGHGTGALKQAIRDWLNDCAWVKTHMPGGRHEGGDGATIVNLKSGINS